jgi:hypothetical protein
MSQVRREAESEDAMVFVRLLDEQQPDKHHGIFQFGAATLVRRLSPPS